MSFKNVVSRLTLASISLAFFVATSTFADSYETNCSIPPENTYRIGGKGQENLYETFQRPDICWGHVNTIIIAPRNQVKGVGDDEYRYVSLVLSYITEARERLANESTDPDIKERAQKPLLITNGLSQANYDSGTNTSNTQVKIGGKFYFSMSLQGGTNWKLSGKGDLLNYPGHFPSTYDSYSNTQGTYGFLIDGYFTKDRNALGVEGYTIRDDNNNVVETKISSDFEIEFIEIARAGFAGMHIKTERRNPGGVPLDNNAYPMENIKIHNNYIHDTVGEGIYLGSTSETILQHAITNIDIRENRIVRTGAEAIQMGQLTGHNVIRNNVFGPAGTDWRAPFRVFQDSAVQIDHRSGKTEFVNNVVIGASNTLLFIADNHVGVPEVGDGVFIKNNYFSGTRYLGAYIKASNSQPDTFDPYGHIPTYRFEGNVWRNQVFQRDLIYPNIADPAHLHATHNFKATIEFVNERWEGENNGLISQLPTGNGDSQTGNISGQGNLKASSISPIGFEALNNVFYSSQADKTMKELNLEVYTKHYGEKVETSGDLVSYANNAVVMTQRELKWDNPSTDIGGEFYQCTSAGGCIDLAPEDDVNGDQWEKVLSPFNNGGSDTFVDNFVTKRGSNYEGIGLTPFCSQTVDLKILPIVGSGQLGNRYFDISNAHNTQDFLAYDPESKQVTSLGDYAENQTAFFYSDELTGRKAFFDLGPDYQSYRIAELWTRYRPWSMRIVDGINTAHTGFKQVYWLESLDGTNEIPEPQVNFHTAKIEPSEQTSEVWKRDHSNQEIITPKGRYLVVETYPLSTNYDYSRAIEFAIVGWEEIGACQN